MNINLANDIISGTCRLTNGSAIVYGDNTNWLASVEPGFLMFIANTFYQIDRVVAAAELLLTLPFEASAGDGGQANPDGSLTYSFQIIPTHAYTLGVNVRLDELVSKLDQQVIDLPIPPANSLGNAQLASMPPGTIKARFAGSAGNPQDITPAQLAQMLENAGYRFAQGNEADGSLVPNGGQTGMVLLKNSDVSGDTTWASVNSLTGTSLPPGGTAGQVLTKVSATAGDAEWLDPEVALGAGWQLLSTLGTSLSSGQTHNFGTTPVTELNITNLAPYTDLRIVMVGVGSVTTGFRWLRVSHDNGATFQTTGYREMVSDFNGGTFNFIETAALQRRWGVMELRNIKGATFFPRICMGDGRGSGMAIYENNPADINAIRIGSSGGAMNSGYVMVYGRSRDTISGETNLSLPTSETITKTALTANLEAADNGKYQRWTNAAAKTLTIQPDATTPMPVNGEWHIRNAGAGNLALVAGNGVVINLPHQGSNQIPAGGTVTIKRVALDVYDLMGVVVVIA
jgi:hypothetical protein